MTDSVSEKAMFRLPGASLLASRLQRYQEAHGAQNIRLHLVGHSAGSIFHAGLIQRLAEAGIPVDSLNYLAPGLRTDEFERLVLPHVGPQKTVRQLSIFDLSDGLELGDSLGKGGLTVYHKSLLYLVARGLERLPRPGMFETPLLGLERSLREPLRPGTSETLLDRIRAAGGEVVLAPSQSPSDARCSARAHGEFDNDEATMTSVLLRILGHKRLSSVKAYQERAPLENERVLAAAANTALQVRAAQVRPEADEDSAFEVAGRPSGAEQPAPSTQPAYTGAPITDLLSQDGWQRVEAD